mgnify:CR=1 FL=1
MVVELLDVRVGKFVQVNRPVHDLVGNENLAPGNLDLCDFVIQVALAVDVSGVGPAGGRGR